MRKLSEDREAKLQRLHDRDCPGSHDIEFACNGRCLTTNEPPATQAPGKEGT